MAEFQDCLTVLESAPADQKALQALESLDSGQLRSGDAANALAASREALKRRGYLDVAAKLLELEIKAQTDSNRRADLLLTKGNLYADDLLNQPVAAECFEQVLAIRPEDVSAKESLARFGFERPHWERFVSKYLAEAEVSTDQSLTTAMYLAAAETTARYSGKNGAIGGDVEAYLRKALEADPENVRASSHLEWLLRKAGEWEQVLALLQKRVSVVSGDERVQVLLAIVELVQREEADPEHVEDSPHQQLAFDSLRQVLKIDPAHRRAIAVIGERLQTQERWDELAALYAKALKAQRRAGKGSDSGLLLDAGTLYWKRVGEFDKAEEYFRRVRKATPGHPQVLAFYREYYGRRNEHNKLLQLLRQAHKAAASLRYDDATRALAEEMAQVAEEKLRHPDKAIDAWKSILRSAPQDARAREQLKRIYHDTGKWNALLDLLKDEVDSLDESDVDARVARMLEVLAIYRDRLKLDVMVINTYDAILKLDPENIDAIDQLAIRYEQLSRWTDLIKVLSRRAELASLSTAERVETLKRIAKLQSKRFGKHAQAAKPLSRILELAPGDQEALFELKEIYTKRRQWRPLIGILRGEAESLPPQSRLESVAKIARIASERLGDHRLAIELWNQCLEISANHEDALYALSGLYEREKRYLPLVEVLRRRRALVGDDSKEVIALLEREAGILVDRLKVPKQAVPVFEAIIALDPRHRAVRTLRTLLAEAGDFEALERLYGKLGHWEDLIESLFSVAERTKDLKQRQVVLERNGEIAAAHLKQPDKIARVYERILELDPAHAASARALVPIYERAHKWQRLLSVHEVLLEHTESREQKLELFEQIGDIFEKHLASHEKAFQWAIRALEIDPDNESRIADLIRVGGSESEWRQVMAILEPRLSQPELSEQQRATLLHSLAKIAKNQLGDSHRARAFYEQILKTEPGDSDALAALEDIATTSSDWPFAIEVYRQRIAANKDEAKQLEYLFRIAFIAEECLGDVDAAIATYHEILDRDSGSQQALIALEKIYHGRDDWEPLTEVLERHIAAGGPAQLHVRLGEVYEKRLGDLNRALPHYNAALKKGDGLQSDPMVRAVYDAFERLLHQTTEDIGKAKRADIARSLIPVYERSGATGRLVDVLEILRKNGHKNDRPDCDRRLVRLYGEELAAPDQAYKAGVRLLSVDPSDRAIRALLAKYARDTDQIQDWVVQLGRSVDELVGKDKQSAVLAEIAAELAEISEHELDDLDRAQRAWQVVLGIHDGDPAANIALERIYRSQQNWPQLRALLVEQAQREADQAQRKTLLFAISELDEDLLEDTDAAIENYQRVLEIDPGDSHAFGALEKIYTERKNWQQLELLLANCIPALGDPAQQIELRVTQASLRARHLSDGSGAVALLEEVLAKRPRHPLVRELLEELLDNPALKEDVAQLLEPLYRLEARWPELCKVLQVQESHTQSPDEAVDILIEIATIHERELGDGDAAFATYTNAFVKAPKDPRPREELLRLATALGEWEPLSETYERVLAKAGEEDREHAAGLSAELGAIYRHRLYNPKNASIHYQRILDLEPQDTELIRNATRELTSLYEDTQQWNELNRVIRRQLAWLDSKDDRCAGLTQIAQIAEEKLDDIPVAIQAWQDVLLEDPANGLALESLERLYGGQGNHLEIVELLQRRVQFAESGNDKAQFLRRIAQIHEVELDSVVDAIEAQLEVLDHLDSDRDALSELCRLYRVAERYEDLLATLLQRLQLSNDDSERADLTFQLASLLHKQLGRQDEALMRFAEVLEFNPAHQPALAAVESMVGDKELHQRAMEILHPLYQQEGAHADLVELLLRVAETTQDGRQRVLYLKEAAAVREQHLDDKDGAFDAIGLGLRDAVSEPELAELVDHWSRLASELGREQELIDGFRGIAPDVLDADLKRRLLLDVADLSRAINHDSELAREYYLRVLDIDPNDRRGLGALENIYRSDGKHEKLNDVLVRIAGLTDEDSKVRIAALRESADLCAKTLGRRDDAIIAWEQILEIEPQNDEAAAALEVLYTESNRHVDLVSILERRLKLGDLGEEAIEIRFRLGMLYGDEMSDPDQAIANYGAALSGNPGHEGVAQALEKYLNDETTRTAAAEILEPIYVAKQDWRKIVKIYEIKRNACEPGARRVTLTRAIARTYEEQLEDLDGAFRWYGHVFREVPGDQPVRYQLVRLATVLEDWGRLARIYQEYLDEEESTSPIAREIALALAEIYDRRLDDVGRALAAYQTIFAVTPDDLGTFVQLEEMLTRKESWSLLVEVYEEFAMGATEPQLREDLYLRMAVVHEQRMQDKAAAIDAYRAVLDVDADSETALDQLQRLYAEQEQWLELVELLSGRIDSCSSEIEETQYRIELATVLENHLGDVSAAIDHYERVLSFQKTWREAIPPLERLIVDEDYRYRIAQILEPIYRANDWWQKLVVIVDAQLKYTEDPQQLVSMLREIASIHDERGGDQRLALRALSQAWSQDPTDMSVYEEFVTLATKLEAWEELVTTLEEGVGNVYDYKIASQLWREIAQIHDSRRGDHPKAIHAWRQVLEAQDDDPQALTALDRLYCADKRFAELVLIVERQAELALSSEDADANANRKEFLLRGASIRELQLNQIDEAISAYKGVLVVDPKDANALDALERLYRANGDYGELVEILSAKIELAEDMHEERPIRLGLADVYEKQLHDPYEAIAQLVALLEFEPNDREALARIDDLYIRESMWGELIPVLDRRAMLEADPLSADLAFRAACLVEKELLDVHEALKRYADVLQVAPKHSGARDALEAMTGDEETMEPAIAALEGIYREERSYDKVASLYEKRLLLPMGDMDIRRQHFTHLVEVHEVLRGDLDSAFSVWSRALKEMPADVVVQGQLERIAAVRGSWEQLASIFEERLADAGDPELEYVYATKLATLYEEALDDLERAAQKYTQAMDVAADEREPLAALDRIYSRSGQSEKLAEILSLEADASREVAEQADFYYRLGELHEQSLRDVSAAVSAYQNVLDRASEHSFARTALERLQRTNEDYRMQILEILEPLYESDKDYPQLIDTLVGKLGVTEHSFDRAQLYSRIADIAQDHLRDPIRALDAAGGWLVEDPESEQALAALTRFAAESKRWPEFVARLSGIVDSVESEDVAQALLGKLGTVQLSELGDDSSAEKTFRRILDLHAESEIALKSLETIYRDRGDKKELSKILFRRGQLAFDGDGKRDAFVEVAQIHEQLGDADRAIEVWLMILELNEADREAYEHLASLYESTQAWQKLVDILKHACRFADDAKKERVLRTRIAQIHTDKLKQIDEVVEAWQSVLDIAPDAIDALSALEVVHSQRDDWIAVSEVLNQRLQAEEPTSERLATLERLADISYAKRESVDDAVEYLNQMVAIEPNHPAACARLEQLLAESERWSDLVEQLMQRVAIYTKQKDKEAEVVMLLRVADVWEGPLANPDEARDVLEKVLSRRPSHVGALTRLAKIYENEGDWSRCGDILQRALTLGPTGREAADLYFRLGEVERNHTGNEDQALGYFQQALRYDGSHPESVSAVLAHAEENEDWPTVANMLNRRLLAATEKSDQLPLALRLAELYVEKMKLPNEALPLFEHARDLSPEDPQCLVPLADVYYLVGHFEKATPILEQLAAAAKKARKMKDVARYRQRLGRIYENSDAIDQAITAYEEAFRIHPTDIATMAGLGRIYMQRQVWDKARRIYRSLVLQNLDPKHDITKDVVYYNLGMIHLALGENAKAKGMFQRGLEVAPKNEELKEALASLST